MAGKVLRTLPKATYLGVAAAVLAAFVLGVVVGSSGHDPRLDTLPELPSMRQCLTETLAALDLKQAPTPEILRQALEHCYALIQSQGLLRDFTIREVNYLQQYRANAILLWMVVAVTLSGVILAGIQLMVTFHLASSRKAAFSNDQISIRRDQVVLKSSVTGLFILMISFGFFLVFVTYVYRFQRPDDQSPRPPPQTRVLPMGQLGPPTNQQ